MRKILLLALLGLLSLVVSTSADTYGPTTSIISPIGDAVISKSNLRVLVQVWDTDGLHATTPIEISLDAGAYSAVGISDSGRNCVPAGANCTIYQYTWDLSAYGDNTVHSLSARTKDALNQTTTKSVSITARNAKTGDGNLLARERADQLCIDCHNVASHSSQATDTGYGNWAILCTDCHTPHNTKNIMIVKDSIITPSSGAKAVQFYNRTGDASNSFADSSAGASTKGVCQVCHTQTKDPISADARWRNSGNSDPAHYAAAPGPTQRCTVCHPHTAGFKGDCNLCHDSPPGVSTGKHAIHVGAGKTIYGSTAIQSTAAEYRFTCGICHNGTHINTVGNPHTVEVTFAGVATQDPASGSASYTAGAFSVDDPGRGWTFNYSNGTCSSVYCHGNYPGSGKNASPTFGAASTAPCGSCHEASNTTVPASGTHKRHASAGTVTGATSDREYACTLCHNGIVSGSGPASYSIADKAKHVSGFVDWSFNIADPRITGSSVYSVATGTALPSNGTSPRAYGTCNNIYCHSIVQTSTGGALTPDTADYKTPTWGSTVGCGTCHKGDMGHNFGNLMDSGSHTRHLEYDLRLAGSATLKCTICHKWNAGAAFGDCNQCHSTAQEKSLHVNRSVNVAFDSFFGNGTYSGTAAPGDGFGDCSNTYCHSTGTGGTTNAGETRPIAANTSAAWGSGALDCNSCHGSEVGNDGTGRPFYDNGSPKANSHNLNKHSLTTCDKCHYQTTQDGTSIFSTTNHVNRIYNVNGTGADPYAFTYTYNVNGGTCATGYCHGAASPSWGTTGTLTCNSCHSSMGAGGAANYTGKHQTHVDTAGYDYSCEICHSLVNGVIHVNGEVIAGTQSAEFGFRNSTTSWQTGQTYNGSASTYKYRSLTNNPYMSEAAVSPSYTSAGAVQTDPIGSRKWRLSGSCSNVWCHSNANPLGGSNSYSSITWDGSVTCSSCHRTADTAANMAAAGTPAAMSAKHVKHLATDGYGVNTSFTCNACHSGTASNNTTVSNKANHANAAKNIVFNAWVNSSGTYGSGECSNIYCHSQGTNLATSDYTGQHAPNTTPAWNGSATACNSCHGNSTYSDYRKASPLYDNNSPKRNSHYYHTSQQASPSNEIECINCHGATVGADNASIADKTKHTNKAYEVTGGGTYWDFGSVGEDVYATVAPVTIGSYDQGTGKCTNVSCHPAAPTAQKSWDSSTYLCVDCHLMSLEDSTTYHHAIKDANTGPGYPLQSPDGDATTGNFPENRKCLMCHADHDVFSPLLNPNSPGRSSNLRVSIDTAPDGSDTNTFTNHDYDPGFGGICVSCHQQERIKDESIRRPESNNTRTPAITNADFAVSAHQYEVLSYFTNGSSQFAGNCIKCHDTQEKEINTFQGNYVANTNRFGVHKGPIRRLQANLGIEAPVETEEEDLCYRCHSKSTDSNPGNGPAKAVANKDYYGIATMSKASQDIYTVMQTTGSVAGPSSRTNRLYFRPTAAESPAEPMPNAHQTGDTFAGGAWIGRAMNPWTNATAYETATIAVGSGTNIYRGITFVSPDVVTPITVASGTWTINIYCRESSTSANAYVRYMIYKWNAADSLGTTIVAAGNHTLEMSTTAAPGAARTISVIGNAVTLAAGDKIAVDIEVRTSLSGGSYNTYYYFGNNAQGSLSMPSFIEFNYADPGRVGYGHNVKLYDGLHKPSNYDEDLTYISNNKHVECTDCHNMHAVGKEKHADRGTATSGTTTVLTDTTKSWTTNQWAGKTLAIVGGTNAGQAKTISSNTATTITVSSAFSAALTATSQYTIVSGTNAVSNVLRGVPGAVIDVTGGSVSKLYFRNTTPTGNRPTSSQSTDTFTGGTWQSRDMLSAQGSAAQSQTVTINNTGNPRYWRMTSFVSPPVTANSTVNAGNWTIHLYASESNAGANAYMRATIYVWRSNNTKGTVIVAPTSYGSELTTTSTAYDWTLSGAGASLNTGDRIVVELEVETKGATWTFTSPTVTYRWNGSGTTNDSNVIMPNSLPMGSTLSNWTAPTYQLGIATKAAEICFKCHSGANTKLDTWNATETTTLYLGAGTPSSPPAAHQSTDTFTAGTFVTDLMVTSGATAGSDNITVTNSGANIYYRGTAFLSPVIAEGTTIPAGTWTLNIWARENNSGSNAWLRAYIYVWKADNTKVEIAAPTTEGRELTLTTKTLETWTLNQAASIAVSAGDRIAVEVYIHSKSATSTTSSADVYFGGADNSRVTMPGSLKFSNTGPATWMDVGLAFNPANKSGHPVIASLNNYTNSATPKALAAATMNNGWTAVGTQTMYCTDCHDTDSTASLGPHGSSVKWLLAGLNKAWPFTTTAGNGTSSGTTWKLGNYSTGTAPDKLFCLNCHTINNTNWAHQNLSSRHSASGTYGACVSCHIRIPHGGKVARLLRTDNTPARLLPDGNGGDVSGQSIQMFSSIKKANPYTNSPGFNDAGCGMHSTSGAETW